MPQHEVASRAQWLEARRALLAEEKAWTKSYDRLMQRRRALPWVKVEKPYIFDSVDGPVTLAELFDGRSQLIVQHFMFAPGWAEGCVGCSFKSDHVDGALQHLEHHDVTFVSVSRGPLAEITEFKERMGWRFKWVSSYGNDFNYDFGVSFRGDKGTEGDAGIVPAL